MKVIVVGAGVGGLASAIRLAAAGHQVEVLERNPIIGGKLATLEEGGYSFELGPTVLTMPHLFDELFQVAGTTLANEVELVRLDPQIRYRWPNGSTLDVPDDEAALVAGLELFSPGSGLQWTRFAAHAAKVWENSEQSVLAGRGRVHRWRRWRGCDLRSTSGGSTATERSPSRRRLISTTHDCSNWSAATATYTGSSPFQAPATLAWLAHVERAFGCWYVMGGLGRLGDALARVATGIGVTIRLGTDVGRIAFDGRKVTGVELADGGTELADLVVSDVDAAHLYTDLLPHPKQAKRLDQAGRSSSAFLICAAVRGRTEGVAHHNVLFSLHDRQEFRYLEAGQMAIDPTVYACVSSVTDPGQAPPDGENWYMLVSTPPATGIDRKLMTAAVLNRLAERGFDLRDPDRVHPHAGPGRLRRSLPRHRRGDLRHVLEREAGRIRATQQRRPGRRSVSRRRLGPSGRWPANGGDRRPDRGRPGRRSAWVILTVATQDRAGGVCVSRWSPRLESRSVLQRSRSVVGQCCRNRRCLCDAGLLDDRT